ncbi:hypothetical protein Q8A73_002984 [Channa argus]|nr:hypothetical protein Q8A73_002984 [Channa argus]
MLDCIERDRVEELLSLSGVTVLHCEERKQMPHVKLIARGANSQQEIVCGGSLISDKDILTVARCWQEGRTMYAVLGGKEVQIREQLKIHESIMILTLPTAANIDPISLGDCKTPLNP